MELKKAGEEDCVLALEDVGNPRIISGTIMRSCAPRSVKGVVVQDAGVLESGAAIRTAEGGAEHVEPITGDSFIDTLDQFLEKRAARLSQRPAMVPRCLKPSCRRKWCWR